MESKYEFKEIKDINLDCLSEGRLYHTISKDGNPDVCLGIDINKDSTHSVLLPCSVIDSGELKSKIEKIIESTVVIASDSGDSWIVGEDDATNMIIELVDQHTEQQCNLIQELFTRPTKELDPLQDLWRKENPRDKFTIPDQTKFFKWIREKVLSAEYGKLLNDGVIDIVMRMKDDSGREGCTYGDTEYDSLSACYGYNLAIEDVVSTLKTQLKNHKK